MAALAAVLVGLAVWSGNRQNTTVTHAGTVTTTSAPAATPGSAATSSTSAAVTTTATEPPVSSTTSTTSPEPSTSASGPAAAPRAADRPDPALTPGVADPAVTQANIHSTICVRGWTRTVRPPVEYTNGLKVRQMRDYGETGPSSAYQEDHLISLELGGDPTDARNLWPEPYPRASAVDQIENELNAKVCSGDLTLAQAQSQESALKHTQG